MIEIVTSTSNRLLACLAALAVLSAPSAALAASPRIVVLGDSLTSGRGIGKDSAYPAILQERLEDAGYEYEMINAGVSGDTTTRALKRYPDALEGDVRILILALGANDGLRGMPVSDIRSNLSTIIEDAQRRRIDVVLVGMDALPMHGWEYSLEFHRLYEDLAARYRIPLVPFILVRVMRDPGLMQSDHVHPNKAGARAIADLIWPYLEPMLKKIV